MMIKDRKDYKIDELLDLPLKPFTEVRTYESIIVVPTNYEHDSGWRLMAIIGCNKVDKNYNVPVEIAGYCDDINFIMPERKGDFNNFPPRCCDYIHSDMLLSNCIRFWSNFHDFKIGCCCSSTEIEIIYNTNKY